MKKTISILLILLLLNLTACNDKHNESGWRIVTSFSMIEAQKKGMFVVNTLDAVSFLDFTTMEESPLCDDPTCKHTKDSNCSSFNKNNHPFVYSDKIYYFKETDLYSDDDLYKQNVQLWQCSLNGDNEKMIYEFNGFTWHNYDTLLVDDDNIYMCMTKQWYDSQYKELEPSINLISYNLKTSEMVDFGEIISGYSSNAYIKGKWEDKIIILTSAAKNNKPYLDRLEEYAKNKGMSTNEVASEFMASDEYIDELYQLGADDSKIEESNMPEPLAITSNYYFYIEESSLKYKDVKDKVHEISSISDISDIRALGKYDILISEDKKYIFDEEKEKCIEISSDYYSYDFIAECDDEIIYSEIKDDGNIKYSKAKVSDLEV